MPTRRGADHQLSVCSLFIKRTGLVAGTLLLLVSDAFAITRTWTAGGAANDWNNAANWNPAGAPVAGDSLSFPTGLASADKTMTNTLPVGTSLASLSFQDNFYAVSGNAVTLTTGMSAWGDTTVSIPITLGSASQTFGATTNGILRLGGAISMGSNDLTFSGPGAVRINANISGAAGSEITFTGSGRKEISFSSTVAAGSGGTVANATGNEVLVNGTWSTGTLLVNANGVVGGTGTIFALTLNGGALAPGAAGVGRLTIGGGAFTTNNVFGNSVALELGAATGPGTTYDQLRCTGGVSLSSVALNLTTVAGYGPSIGQVFTLLDNTGTTPISGTFAGMAEGTVVTLGGARLRISYIGGSGNDCTATVIDSANNDPPVNSVPPTQTTNEDTARTFTSITGNGISISDPDAGSSSVSVTLSATSGTVTLSGTAGLTFTQGDGTADPTMAFTGTITNINSALNGMAFSPSANFHGNATLAITTNDLGNTGPGGALSDSDSVSIVVTPTPDTRTWTSTTNSFWSTANNWDAQKTPESGDSLVFPQGSLGQSFNDLASGLSFGTIAINGAGYSISGNSLSCTALSFIGGSTGSSFTARLNLQQNLTVTANGAGPSSIGEIVVAEHTITFHSATATDEIRANGSIGAGNGGLVKTGPGVLRLNTQNSYGGATNVTNGTLLVTGAGTLPPFAVTNVSAGAKLDFQRSSSTTTAAPLAIAGTLSTGQLPVTCSAPVSFGGAPAVQGGAGGLSFAGMVSGSGQPSSTGSVAVTATGTLNTAGWKIDGGSLTLDGNGSATPVVLSGGTLTGTGAAGAVSTDSDGGTISPANAIGALQASGVDLTGGTATVRIEANATANDVLVVSGQVKLGAASLALVNAGTANAPFAPPIGQVLTIVSNDGADAVAGTLNGLSEGSVATLAFYPFRISYAGGDGNDVTLTRVEAAATGATRIWDGGGQNNLWSTPANWVGDATPAQGDSLRFPAGAAQATNVNDLPAGFTVGRLEIEGGGYTISGNRLRLLGDVEHSGNATAKVELSTALVLAGATKFRKAATGGAIFDIKGEVDTAGYTLTLQNLSAAGDILIHGNIFGPGKVVVDGTSVVTLRDFSNRPTWTGGTDVVNGQLTAFGTRVAGPLRIGGGSQAAVCRLDSPNTALQLGADITFLPNGRMDISHSIYVGDLIFSGGLGIFATPEFPAQGRVSVDGDLRFLVPGATHGVATYFAGDVHELEVAAGLEQAVTAPLALQGGRLVKTGAGKLRLQRLASGESFGGAIEAKEGSLSFLGDFISCPVVLNGGVLSADRTDSSARIGDLTATAAGGLIELGERSLAPGFRTSVLTAISLAFNDATTFRAALETRPTKGLAATAVDTIIAIGAVALNNAAFEILPLSGFEPYAGQTITVIRNDSSQPISGTFAGIPEGHVLTVGRVTFRCSYVGGDGNDFVLTVGLVPTGVTRVWDGGGANSLWSTPQNWVGDVAPVPGDSIELVGNTPRPSSSQDYPEGTTFHTLRVTGSGVSVSGQMISLTGGIQVASTSTGQNSLPQVRIVEAPSIVATGPAFFGVHATLLTSELTVDIGAGPSEYSSGVSTVTLINTQPAFVMKQGAGPVVLTPSGPNLPPVNVRIDAGSMRLRNFTGDVLIGGAGQSAKAVFLGPVSSHGTWTVNGTITAASQGMIEFRDEAKLRASRVVLNGGSITQTASFGSPVSTLALLDSLSVLGSGIHTIPSRVSFDRIDGGSVNVNVASGAGLTIAGELFTASSAFLTKIGAGTLTLAGAAAPFEPLLRMDVAAGQAFVNAALPSLHARLTGGTVGGNGRVATIETTTTGTVAPGNSPGLLRSGAVTWNANTTLALELGGTTAGATYDQVQVDNAVSLGSSSLAISSFGGFLPSAGQSFVVLAKTSGGAITGTFNNLPHGASFTAVGRQFTINYSGGDGNDVALTCQGYDPTDADDDDLPDAWEQEFFGNLGGGAADDPDGDGNSNLEEYIAGTSPVSATSSIVVRVVQAPGAAAIVGVKPVIGGRNYVLERATDLVSGSFVPVAGATFTDVGDERRFTDPAPPAGRAFYRIRIEQAP